MTLSHHPQPLVLPLEDSARGRLMTATATLFAEAGYGATSMRDIARAAGVTPGAIYAHFESKQALLLNIFEVGVAIVSDAVETAITGVSDPWKALEAAVAAHLQCLVDTSPFAAVIVRVLPADAPEIAAQLIALRDRYEANFKRLFDALPGDRRDHRQLHRLLMLGAMNWTPTWYAAGGVAPREIAATLCNSLRHGIDEEG